MKPYYEDDLVTLHHGDCLGVLAELPDDSVDSVVCDPPYGLANTDPAHVAETITRWVNGERDYLPGGSGFMGKAWDAFVPPVAVWDECLRVLKPGGHVLTFAGSRTVDLMTLGLRLAGFDIRDSIAWLYGSGFPKSLDVSKAIDKRRDWTLVGKLADAVRVARAESGLSLREVGEAVRSASGGAHGEWYHRGGHMFFETGMSLPGRAEWQHLRSVLPIPPEFDAMYEEAEREVVAERKVTDRRGDGTVVGLGHTGNADITAPATPDAERWQGWGTALKPSHEPVVVARKPHALSAAGSVTGSTPHSPQDAAGRSAFEPVVVARKPLTGTVAANVLQHGTGALNIDGCRVEGAPRTTHAGGNRVGNRGGASSYTVGQEGATYEGAAGRWPTNVVLDDTQAAVLDEQSGDRPAGGKVTGRQDSRTGDNGIYGAFGAVENSPYNDSGGASRFFPTFRYEAKAPIHERPKVNGTAHPTVKPLDLMRWLARLVTPPGGTVLEPFAGSGTTVEAAILEGFRCIAIEREVDYLPLIMSRIHRRRDPIAALKLTEEDLGLFGEPA